jgi:hypothetical protein
MPDDPIAPAHAPPAPSEVVQLYGAAWHEHDERARRALLERCWARDGVYSDPTVLVEGREALVAHMGEFQQRRSGHRLELRTGIDEHHGWLRFGWRLLGADGEVALDGLDLAELDVDGRLRRIVGFFDPLAPV